MDITQILIGAGAGVTYGLTGFAKSEGEQIDWVKLGTTVIIGAAAGAVGAVAKWELPVAYDFMISAGAVAIIENALKALKRKIWNRMFTK